MRFISRWTIRFVAAGAVGLLVVTGSALATSSLAGDPQGIKLGRAVLHAYSKIPVYTYTQSGFVAMNSALGKVSYFEWRWGNGGVPNGWVKASERGVAALRRGHVVWWRDDLTPKLPRCSTTVCNHSAPVDIVVDHAGAFYAFGSAASHTCYTHLSGSTPFTAGGAGYAVAGRVSAPAHRGAAVLLTYTYPWSKTQTANETDTVSAATSLVTSGRVSVTPGAGHPAFRFNFSDRYPRSAPGAPHVNLCK
jgi:hypothetical protein